MEWEEELVGELRLLLQNVTLQVDKDDRWLWSLESSHAFSVRSAYNFLTFQPHITSTVVVSSLWHKDVPLKVVLFAWRLFQDRLPTKDNLLRRGVIDDNSRMCVGGCGSMETSSHLFLHCNNFGSEPPSNFGVSVCCHKQNNKTFVKKFHPTNPKR